MNAAKKLSAQIPERLAGFRLDQALCELFSDFSRSKLQSWIRAGRARVNGHIWRPKDRIEGGEWVELEAEAEEVTQDLAQPIPLAIVYEDETLLVIDKPAGLVVHPAAGHKEGTLLNALLHYAPELAQLPRAGLVHRLDKDTSGLLVIARTLKVHKYLVEQLHARAVRRDYLAVAQGRMTAGSTIDQPIGRHPVDRKRFAVREGGKPAVTHYRIEERFPHHTLIRVSLETGRTHQIRVHMAHIHHPLLGDPVYGGRLRLPPGADEALIAALRNFRRQALHAAMLSVSHPVTGERYQWQAELPEDMQNLLDALRKSPCPSPG